MVAMRMTMARTITITTLTMTMTMTMTMTTMAIITLMTINMICTSATDRPVSRYRACRRNG